MVVFLVGRSHKLSLKQEMEMKTHHDLSDANLSASLEAFRSHVANYQTQLSLSSKPNSDSWSLTHIQRCLGLLSMANKALAKLASDIQYPMRQWQIGSTDAYLSYSLSLLEFLNSFTSSLSHLCQARLALSHALSPKEDLPLALDRLKPIQWKSLGRELVSCKEESRGNGNGGVSGNEWVIQQALVEVKRIGLWVKKSCVEVEVEVDEGGVMKEVREVNEAVAWVVSAMAKGEVEEAEKELRRRMEGLQKLAEDVGSDANRLFSEVLAARTELLDSLRQKQQ